MGRQTTAPMLTIETEDDEKLIDYMFVMAKDMGERISGTYCPECEDMTAQVVESFSGDYRTGGQMQGVDLSRYVCTKCQYDWWD